VQARQVSHYPPGRLRFLHPYITLSNYSLSIVFIISY